MAKRLILLFTLFIHANVYSANAYGEGEYNDNVREISREMSKDISIWYGDEELIRIFLKQEPFMDICNHCNRDKKLSICIRAVQHKWKAHNPTSFTVNPTLSDFECNTTQVYTENDLVCFKQRMFVCPPITVKMSGRQGTEPSFLVGQRLHPTQYGVYIYKRENPAMIEGQLTGISLNKLNFPTENVNFYEYIPENDSDVPENDSGSAVIDFRSSGIMDDYRFEWEGLNEDGTWRTRYRSEYGRF